uniref:Uncharacterized protein n=1 Tax=Panagrolaimus davidi TaxID=227884 RepID=A0A914QQ51_9BILA
MFNPKIDLDLLPRFMKLLNKYQKYSMAFSYPNILKSLQPLKVSYENEMRFTSFNTFDGLDYAVIDHATVVKMDLNKTQYYGLSFLKLPDFHIRHLEIHQTPFSSEDLLKLLSHQTKTFSCPVLDKIVLNPWLTLVEILKKAPKLEEIDFDIDDLAVFMKVSYSFET